MRSEQQAATPALRVATPPDEGANGDPAAEYNPSGRRYTDACTAPAGHGPMVHDYNATEPAPGDIALRWIHGSVCAATNTDPRIQVIAYNEDTYILRENPCVHWEAPFTYLLFGNEGALLIDTGATAEAEFYPLRATVDRLVERWCSIRRRRLIPLTIVLTSAEDVAQNQGIGQFDGRVGTVFQPKHGVIDLGGRKVTAIATPGTHRDGVTFYDSYTQFLLTGDLLYAGRVQVANDRDYVQSLERLVAWTKSHPVKWLMGGHVEMMFVPGRAYPRFANHRPFEHVLQLEPALLEDALVQAREVVGRQAVVFRTDYILLNRVGPDEQNYRTSPDMPKIPVPFWLP